MHEELRFVNFAFCLFNEGMHDGQFVNSCFASYLYHMLIILSLYSGGVSAEGYRLYQSYYGFTCLLLLH